MSNPTPPPLRGFLGELLREEARLPERVGRVFRLDDSVYAEIQTDPHALPGAFTVVLATAVCVGLGQPSLAGIFLGIAGAIAMWGAVSALVWATGTLVSESEADFTELLVCTGFAFAWIALLIAGSLPWVGWLLEWAGILLWTVSLALATRRVFQVSSGRAAAIVAVALLGPLLLVAVAT